MGAALTGLQMSAEVADVVNTFRMLAELPPDSLGAYVISMARSASDVLAVVLMQRECGVKVCALAVRLLDLADGCCSKNLFESLRTMPVQDCHILKRCRIMRTPPRRCRTCSATSGIMRTSTESKKS